MLQPYWPNSLVRFKVKVQASDDGITRFGVGVKQTLVTPSRAQANQAPGLIPRSPPLAQLVKNQPLALSVPRKRQLIPVQPWNRACRCLVRKSET